MASNPSVLWICSDYFYVEMRKDQLNYPKDIFFAAPGTALVGRGFDVVILDPLLTYESQYKEWIEHATSTKLYPNGKVVDLRDS